MAMSGHSEHSFLAETDPVRDTGAAVALPDGTQAVPLGSGVITRLLGKGGMAWVYEIWCPDLEVHHAVKLIKPDCSRDSLQRFQTEIKITAKLHHPNIAEIYSVGQWRGLPFIEMEKIEGIPLDVLLFQRGALPVPVCTAAGIMVGRALRYAHNQDYVIYGKRYHGIIHRDLKPGNIMICTSGTVKLMDFGIARPTDASFHTMEGFIVGTLQYLSPEQLHGETLDIRTDIYSLGATLYEILTAVPAFPEKNIHKLLVDKTNNNYKRLDTYDMSVPGRLKSLIHRCMVYERDKRMTDAGVFLNELGKIHRALTGLSPEEVMRRFLSSPTGPKIEVEVRRNRAKQITLPILAMLAIAVLGAGIVLWRGKQSKENIGEPEQRFEEMSGEADAPDYSEPIIPEKIPQREPVTVTAPSTPPIQKKTTAQSTSSVKTVRARKPAEKEKSLKPDTRNQRLKTRKEDFIFSLQTMHQSDDLLEIMLAENRQGRFQNVVRIYDSLSPEEAGTVRAKVLKLRALEGAGKTAMAREFVVSNPVDDAEFYLARARYAYNRNDISEAENYLKQSLASSHELLPYSQLKQEVVYFRALCSTRRFDDNPTQETYREALDAWYQLMNEFRTRKNHAYYKKAESEKRRIGEKYHTGRG